MRRQKNRGIRGRSVVLLLAAAFPLTSALAVESPIAKAARADDLATVKHLIAAHADVNLAAADGSTALLWAAYNSDLEMLKALAAARADANVANKYGVTPLLQASRAGDAGVMKALLDAGANVELAHPEGETPLMAAAKAGSLEGVRLLLAHGANANAQESFQQQTALMWAAAEGHAAVVDALLVAGANPNLQAHINLLSERKNADYPSGGFTALMWAARNGQEAIVRRLIAAGSDLNARNGDGATAMMITIVNDRFDLAAKLVDLGADVNDGSLYHAVEMRDATTDWYAHDGSKLRNNFANEHTALDLIALLLDKGADPNKPFVGQMHSASMCCDSFANASPFYRAAVAADVEALKLMVGHGANLEWTPTNAKNGGPGANANVGKTPLLAAINGGKGVPLSAGPGYSRAGPPPFRETSNRKPADAARLLIASGAKVNAVGPDGATALHKAVDLRNLDTLGALIEGGADLKAKNKEGLTALDLALKLKADDPNANPFGPGRNKDGAKPEEVVALLRAAAKQPALQAQASADTRAAR
ncbi:MAG: ankyrin repeat domain-containing protein [Gammaproteobacteria bacterium]